MTWNDLLERMESAGLHPIEETFMENFGKVLAAQRAEFRDRYFRCTYGVVNCLDTRIEVFLFPDPAQSTEFLDLAGTDPWWFMLSNAVLHFSECDPFVIQRVLTALQGNEMKTEN